MKSTVTMSDLIGYVYWFSVIVTISFGCATGVFVTLKNRKEMILSCDEKLSFYENLHPSIYSSVGNLTAPFDEDLHDKIRRSKFYDEQLK